MDENADLPTISEILDTRLSTLTFTVEDVIHVLVNLDVNKSVSPDSIPLRVLSECTVELAPSLNALYNLSLSAYFHLNGSMHISHHFLKMGAKTW